MLTSEPYVQEKEDAKEFELKEGALEFKNVLFQFEKGKPNSDEKEVKMLFNDFNIKIEPGKSNAIVGESGFGKTTLFNLILRIYDA